MEEAARQYLENDIIWGSPVKGEIFQYSKSLNSIYQIRFL